MSKKEKEFNHFHREREILNHFYKIAKENLIIDPTTRETKNPSRQTLQETTTTLYGFYYDETEQYLE